MKHIMISNYTVYKHIFPNGKVYIGITSRKPYLRFDNGNGYKTNPMRNACKKYGWENVLHEIIAQGLTKEDAEKMEIELIAKYDSTNIKYGYNVAKGGHGSNGYKHTKEAKKKMSEWHKGRKVSEKTKQNMSKAQMKDLTNKKFGRLTALSFFHKDNKLWWHCKCECGNYKDVRPDHLTLSKVKSCGCLNTELTVQRNKSEKQRNAIKRALTKEKEKVMKSILISIKRQFVEKILNGKKILEIRKSLPKSGLPCKVYIYCTVGDKRVNKMLDMRGKVVASFTLMHYNKFDVDGLDWWGMKDILLKNSCLTETQLKDYLGDKIGYAWHIEDLHIYDQPKELAEFGLKRPFQSWGYLKDDKVCG